ncbi:MAG: LysR family transcriptional regulator [Acidobacteriaceae bacterium]
MEVRQLKTFCVLAEELNFTRTAERVHTVQSNVTSQIKGLEDELGSPLFDRLGKRVVLTEAGRRFRPYAEKALAAMDQGLRAAKFGSEPAGPLHIYAPESVLTYRLPEVLKLFRKKYPRVELIFRPESDNPLAAELECGKIDLAITMSDSVDSGQLSSLAMRSEDIYLFATPDHPLATKKVYPKDLVDQTLLLTEAGCGYRKKLDLQLAAANIRPQHITEFSSVEAIKQCVTAGLGIGLLPEVVIACELKKKQFALMNWHKGKMSIGTHVLWHKDKWISGGMEAFLEILKARLQPDSPALLLQERAG